ncbi:hypothetical protein [Pelosinus sp. sgz500959]|uniref:hypothetical protein n=1 Tax=Pelosinus sp. sgz500959 TaxID=3242472 RepID=UPI00366E614F
MRNEEIAYNLAQDKDLTEKLKDVKLSIHQPIAKEIHDFPSWLKKAYGQTRMAPSST